MYPTGLKTGVILFAHADRHRREFDRGRSSIVMAQNDFGIFSAWVATCERMRLVEIGATW
jgi:hypothetical protein